MQERKLINGPITIAIRARYEHDTSTTRYNTLRGFSCARIRDRFEHSTRISGRRVLHVDRQLNAHNANRFLRNIWPEIGVRWQQYCSLAAWIITTRFRNYWINEKKQQQRNFLDWFWGIYPDIYPSRYAPDWYSGSGYVKLSAVFLGTITERRKERDLRNFHGRELNRTASFPSSTVFQTRFATKHLSFLYCINCSISAPDQLLVFMMYEFRSNDRFRKKTRQTHVNTVYVTITSLYIYTVSKKQDTKLLPITSPNVNRFSKFFHW